MKPFVVDYVYVKDNAARQYVRAAMERHAGVKVMTPYMKAQRTRLAKLEAAVTQLRARMDLSCPHPLEKMRVEENGREDTLGSWLSGSDNYLKCGACGDVLEEWHLR